MAINRFTRITPLEHTGQFFQLPFEALKTEITAKQTAYDTSQAALDDYLAEAAKQQYLPQDQQESSNRRKILMDQERALRERVGGDLASSSYQDGLRDLLRKDVIDPFYKNAAFMYDQAVNKGVSFFLQNLMFTDKGEAFGGGRASASDDFGIKSSASADFGHFDN